MTPEEFKAWRSDLGFSQQQAADALGISRGSVENYERGERREDNRPVEIPRSIGLACQALALRQGEWHPHRVADKPIYFHVMVEQYGAPDGEEKAVNMIVKNVVDEHGALTQALLRVSPRPFDGMTPLVPSERQLKETNKKPA
ncbi:hypothetical protein X769_09005 [Mesorhizobium sp. LSJC268A00]|nr:hypothetical protein X769_09005 [Mesorhizobium sp. LSJC268A00]